MFRTLRAFAWMRWRVLLNSLERRGSRDVVERFSVAFEQLSPIIMLVVMVPSVVALTAGGGYAGWRLARGDAPVVLLTVFRYLLFGALVMSLIGPLILPAAERTSAVRLLLLPIRRGLLYAGQCMSACADPWILFAAAAVMGVPLGMAAGGAIPAAVITALAGLLLIAFLIGLTVFVSIAIHMVVRNRRRGELLALLVIVGLPLIGMLPGLLEGQRRHRDGSRDRGQHESPAWWTAVERRALSIAPSELYTTITRRASSNPGQSAAALAALAALAGVVHAGGIAMFTRVLGSPTSTGAGRATARASRTEWRIPLVSPGTSAVALNQLRLGLRTPRGRSIVLSPIAVFFMFAAVMWRSGSGLDFGPIRLQSGVGLASFASFIALLSVLPLAVNQFAIDRAGLTLTLLVPLDTPALLRGKAIGNALLAAIPTAIAIVGAVMLFPAGHPAIWLSLPLALVAIYLLIAPVAALLSAIFPRAVDLNSIGRGSNAHGAAGLIGTLGAVLAGLPCLLLTLLASRIVGRASLAPLLLLVWVGACFGVSTLLFRVAAAVFEKRKENLAMVD